MAQSQPAHPDLVIADAIHPTSRRPKFPPAPLPPNAPPPTRPPREPRRAWVYLLRFFAFCAVFLPWVHEPAIWIPAAILSWVAVPRLVRWYLNIPRFQPLFDRMDAADAQIRTFYGEIATRPQAPRWAVWLMRAFLIGMTAVIYHSLTGRWANYQVVTLAILLWPTVPKLITGAMYAPRENLAQMGLILGIISMVAWLWPPLGILASVLGLLYSGFGLRSATRQTHATAGMIMAGIGLVASVLHMLIAAVLLMFIP